MPGMNCFVSLEMPTFSINCMGFRDDGSSGGDNTDGGEAGDNDGGGAGGQVGGPDGNGAGEKDGGGAGGRGGGVDDVQPLIHLAIDPSRSDFNFILPCPNC